MGKVIRINDKNKQYIEDIRELFAKVKFFQDVYWDDNRIMSMALTTLILDFKQYLNEKERENYFDGRDEILKK